MTTITTRCWAGRIIAGSVLGVVALALAGCAATPAAPGDRPGLRYYGGPKQPRYPEQPLGPWYPG